MSNMRANLVTRAEQNKQTYQQKVQSFIYLLWTEGFLLTCLIGFVTPQGGLRISEIIPGAVREDGLCEPES